jgi:hypothetical protein
MCFDSAHEGQETQRNGGRIFEIRKIEAYWNFFDKFLEDKILETEAKIGEFLVANILPFSLSDKLIHLLKSLPGKDVLNRVTAGKQKVTNIVRQEL